jgi:hypothetical protein
VVVPREHAEEVAKAAMPFLDQIGLERLKKKLAEQQQQRKQ